MTIAPQGLNGPRIAVIGGGISGMGAAYALSDSQNVTFMRLRRGSGGMRARCLRAKLALSLWIQGSSFSIMPIIPIWQIFLML